MSRQAPRYNRDGMVKHRQIFRNLVGRNLSGNRLRKINFCKEIHPTIPHKEPETYVCLA